MATTAKAGKRGMSERARDEAITAYLFLSPYLLVTAIFTIGIIAFALYISFTQYNLFQAPQFNGLENYRRALTDTGTQGFIRSLYNIFWYVVIVVPIQTALALFLAWLLNRPIRAQQFFRTMFYAPSVTSSVVISAIFLWLYLRTGVINYAFDQIFGLFGGNWTPIEWLNDPRGLIQIIGDWVGFDVDTWYLRGPSITWMAIMAMNIFTTAPTFMIMYLAALQDIPPSLYEAASIDGASTWHQFRHIVIPMLRPITLLIVVLGTIGTFQVFDQVHFLTAGGPLGTTLTPVYLIYGEALGVLGGGSVIRMGYASAMAFLLGAIIFVFTFFQRRFIESGTEQY